MSFFSPYLWGFFITLLFTLPAFLCAQSFQPPSAKKIPAEMVYHEKTFVDNYSWLRDRENPEVIKYLEDENEFTDSIMAHTTDGQEKLYQEMVARIQETDLSVPVKNGGYYYYSRQEEGQQYDIECRKKGSLDAEEEILLDINLMAEGYDYFSVDDFDISQDHNLLAYSTDPDGSEHYTLFIKDLRTGKLFDEAIPNVSGIEWANDNKTLFYTTLDDTERPYRLYRHTLGDDPENDVLVYEEPDGGFFLRIYKTKDDAFLMMGLNSKVTSEVHFLDADQPLGEFKIIQPRRYKLEYSVWHHNGWFFIVTNDDAQNFKLVKAPVDDPDLENWQDVIPHHKKVTLDYIDTYKKHLVVYERMDGLNHIRVMDFDGQNSYSIDFPEPIYDVWANWNPDYNSPTIRFSYTSFTTPRSVYDFNLTTHERELLKEYEVLGDYDRSRYESKRLYAPAPDGTMIPISVVYKKGMELNGENPLYLTGYGSYGANSDPYFSYSRVSLLDRGFIYAIAHIRGGGELGRTWYEDGKFFNKKNTFTDFIACADYLVEEKFTSSDHLVINGGSAGGLLMGAVTNMRPDLFKVVVADVPFVDVINTMMDETIPLTVVEYDEWGNPNEKDYFDYMLSYSPYDNVSAQDYPIMLVTAGLNDPRVAYWEPAKWVAKLRATKTDSNRLLLKTNMGAGHGGASGRYDRYKEVAFEFAFLFDALGIDF